MLTSVELASLRATQEEALSETATVVRSTLTSDGAGGYTRAALSTATYACRVSSRGVPSEFLEAGLAKGSVYVMITLPQDADVKRTDKLTVDGLTYEVAGFASGGGWETAKRAVCMVVKQ